MKKFIIFLLAFNLTFSLSSIPVSAVTQRGGFFNLEGGPTNWGGGAVRIDWRDLEMQEGQFNWQILTDPSATFVSWKQHFDRTLCENEGGNNCAALTNPMRTPGVFLHDAAAAGKTMRLKLRITEGAMPLWIFGGQGRMEASLHLGPNGDGKLANATGGTLCAFTDYEWRQPNPDCHANTDIAIAFTYPLYPTKEDNAEPVWWNPIFQEKLRIVLTKLAETIQSDPQLSASVEFIEASVGNYGEMILYGKSETGWASCNNNDSSSACICDQAKIDAHICTQDHLGDNICKCDYKLAHIPTGVKLWLASGYSNRKYITAIMNILGIYEDTSNNLPIALSFGAGLYGGDAEIYSNGVPQENDAEGYPYNPERYVIPKAVDNWGSRLYLKFAGFGGNGSWYPEQDFRNYCPHRTRCIWESYGSICSWAWNGVPFPFYNVNTEPYSKGTQALVDIFTRGANAGAYIIMMWPADWRAISNARICGDALANLTNTQVAEIGHLVEAFDRTAPLLWANGDINPTPPLPTPTPTPSCPGGNTGNINCDSGGLIDETDLSILLGSWAPFGPVPTPQAGFRSADLNSDGIVNTTDLSILLAHWQPE